MFRKLRRKFKMLQSDSRWEHKCRDTPRQKLIKSIRYFCLQSNLWGGTKEQVSVCIKFKIEEAAHTLSMISYSVQRNNFLLIVGANCGWWLTGSAVVLCRKKGQGSWHLWVQAIFRHTPAPCQKLSLLINFRGDCAGTPDVSTWRDWGPWNKTTKQTYKKKWLGSTFSAPEAESSRRHCISQK